MLDALLKNLNSEYQVFKRPFINGDTPDYLIVRRGGGVLIIQEREWSADELDIIDRRIWKINGEEVKSPIAQTVYYKENLFNLHISGLFENYIRNAQYWSVVNCVVVFANAENSEIEQLLKKAGAEDKRVEIMGRNNLNKKDFEMMLYRNWISRDSYYFTDDLYASFMKILAPGYHHKSDGKYYFKYTETQKNLAESNPGDYKIKGVVGAGKTIVLAKRAVNAALRTGGKVLILTYNISLRNYILDKIKDVREDFYYDQIIVLNYHDFINSTLNNLAHPFVFPEDFGSRSAEEKESYFDQNYYGNIELFDKHRFDVSKYPAILIDEIQDFKSEWIAILRNYFLEFGGEFVALGDSKQDIYDRVSTLNDQKELYIDDIPGKWYHLNKSFRLSQTITEFASLYQNRFFKGAHSLDNFAKRAYQPALFDSIFYKRHTVDPSCNISEIAVFINDFINSQKLRSEEVCVLSLSIETMKEIDRRYRELSRKKSCIVSETKEFYDYLKKQETNSSRFNKKIETIRKHKKIHFRMDTSCVKFSTVHSYKGWEIPILFLIVQKENSASYRELIYTGFTRCMKTLVIINIDDEELDLFMREFRNFPHLKILSEDYPPKSS